LDIAYKSSKTIHVWLQKFVQNACPWNPKKPKKLKGACKHLLTIKYFSRQTSISFFCFLCFELQHNSKPSRPYWSKWSINNIKLCTLKWLEPLTCSMLQRFLVVENNKVSNMILCLFSPTKLCNSHLQSRLIDFDTSSNFNYYLNDLVEIKDNISYCNLVDVI